MGGLQRPGDVHGILTPQEFLAGHDLTRRLKQLGATDAELAALRFSHFDPEQPFTMWALLGIAPLSYEVTLCKAYCALRWIVLEDPPSSRNRDEAWEYIARALAEPICALGLQTKEKSAQARHQPTRQSGGRWLETMEGRLVRNFVAKPDYRDLPVKELWPHLRAELEKRGFDLIEPAAGGRAGEVRYEYAFEDGSRKISLGRFRNIVSKVRRKDSR